MSWLKDAAPAVEAAPPPLQPLDLPSGPLDLQPLDIPLQPLGLESDYQGPLNLGPGLPPLLPMGHGMPPIGLPPPGFMPEQLPPPGSVPHGLPPMDLPSGLPLGGEVPPGLPPGFPPMDLPPGLPPGFPPGFPQAEPALSPDGPPEIPIAQGPGRPEFMALNGGAIGPPPSEPPVVRPEAITSTLGSMAPGPSEAERKRKRSGVEGLASNRNIRNTGGSVTVYNGYSSATVQGAPVGQAQKASSAGSSAPASTASASSSLSQIQGHQALPRQLPEGWEMKKSRTTGKVYYVNEKLGKSQFEPPAGSTVQKVSSQKKQKTTHRTKDPSADATNTSLNGVMGSVRAKDQNMGRWQKWQKCSRLVNAESPEHDS